MASGSQNMTTFNAKHIIGDSTNVNWADALLHSGSDGKTSSMNTWIFADDYGSTSSTFGFLHRQGDDKFVFVGASTDRFWNDLNTGDTYVAGKLGVGYDPETSGNTYKLYVNGTSNLNGATSINGTLTTAGAITAAHSGAHLYLKNTQWIKGTTPSSQSWSTVEYLSNDSSNNRIALLETTLDTSGNSQFNIYLVPNVANSTSWSGIVLKKTSDNVLTVSIAGNTSVTGSVGASTNITAGTYVYAGTYLQAKTHVYSDTGHFYMKYNNTWYSVLHNHGNGNISIESASGGLYIGYSNTTLVNWMNGRMQLKDGCLSIFPNNSNYREGIRIHATGNWSDITLCGNDNTGDSGTSANSWFIGNNNGNFYIARNGSPGGTAYIGCVSNVWKFVTAADIPEGAANLSAAATAHTLSIYRNGITIPYQMDNANDGGMIRVRGTAESNCILELGTWDDSGAGETIQFNYYPTTSQVTPTYSISVPKHSGTLVTTDGHGASGSWGISVTGSSASCTGNSATTSKLLDSDHSWTATEVYNYMTARVLKAGDTMTGQLYINYDQDVNLGQNGSLIIGAKGGVNIGIDGNEIMARNNSAASTLYLNSEGGNVYIGSGGVSSVGTVASTAGYLKSTSNSNTIQIGSQNTSFCHIESSANVPFWFNRSIYMAQNTTIGAAGTNYRPFQLYLGRYTTTDSNALNANNPLIEFSNSDRSQYCQLIYTDHDTVQAPDSLTLVGNQNGTTFICKNGPIWVQGGSNAGGNVNRLTTTSGTPGNMQYNTSRRGVQIYANGIAFADPYNGNSNNDAGWIRHIEETANTGTFEFAVGDDNANEAIVFRRYTTSNTVGKEVYIFDASGNSSFPGTVTATKFSGPLTGNVTGNCSGSSGSCTGNAATATKLSDSAHSWTATEVYNYMTARVLKAGDTMSGSLTISRTTYTDGGSFIKLTSNSKSIGLHVGAGGTNRGVYDWTAGAWLCYYDSDNKGHFNGNVTGNCSGSSGSCTGNAATTSKLLDSAHSWTATGVYNYMTARVLKAGDTMTGALNFANNTLNNVGDDCAMGDQNSAGAFCLKGLNGATNIRFIQYGGTAAGTLTWNGSNFAFNTPAVATRLHATSDVDAVAGSVANVALITGPHTGIHIEYDGNELIAKSNASTKSTLYFNENCYVDSGGKLYNAVWNDFAEYRSSEITEPGRVVISDGTGQVIMSQARLEPCAHVISDTYGMAVGESDQAKTPLGVAGRVLVIPFQDRTKYHIGDCVCSAPNGTADIMTREEIIKFPDRIIGIVDEIPTYENWNQTFTTKKRTVSTTIKVNGRIWIYVK